MSAVDVAGLLAEVADELVVPCDSRARHLAHGQGPATTWVRITCPVCGHVVLEARCAPCAGFTVERFTAAALFRWPVEARDCLHRAPATAFTVEAWPLRALSPGAVR